MFFTSLLVAIYLSLTGLISPAAAANGINCKGSSDCDFTSQNNMGKMVDLINSLDDSVCVSAGQKLACIDAAQDICAFPQQNTGQVCAPELKKLIAGLKAHGCTNCGSIPFDYLTGGNNDHLGELTVNVVLGGCINPNTNTDLTGCCPGIKCN